MDLRAFTQSLERSEPPAELAPPLRALWLEAKGDWPRAHQTAQKADGPAGAWVHAYLHRVEGDEANAGYWYRRADQAHPRVPVAEEWRAIAQVLLDSA